MIDLSIDTSTTNVWLPDASTAAASNSPCLTMRSAMLPVAEIDS